MANRLVRETSPYLLLHKDNPVDWHPWDEQALSAARQSGKPVLLSIGYSACHWCHVMAHESFEDEATATLMNDLFVNIKVDREERPDLDAIYQSALANLGKQRGWPLTMFLTPSAQPFAGGTYYPPTARQGVPAFSDILQANADAHANDPRGCADSAARRIAELELDACASGRDSGNITVEFTNHVASTILDGMDVVYGGLGTGAKFPQPMLLELLLRAYHRTGHAPYRDMVVLTAEQMCLGGIYDHLGGGFARYSVDDRWLAPHFEKMLYDNALIVSVLVQLWRSTKQPLFHDRIHQTVAWMLREMQTDEGGFASSLAADSEGYGETDAGEGAFYVWDEAQIDAALGEDSAWFFKTYYDVCGGGNWQGKTILNRTDNPPSDEWEDEDELAALREKLFVAREARPRPQRDDKILADWNGLAIAALADAGSTFGVDEWMDTAVSAYAFVCRTMSEGNSLRHAYRAGKCTPIAVLDDYANMAHAAVRLYELTGDFGYLQQARTWVAVTDTHYWDAKAGGYFYTADDATSMVTRTRTATETATPSGNGMMVGVLARLYALTGVDSYRQRAEDTVAAFGADSHANYVGMASLINHSELLRDMMQIVILGQPGQEGTRLLAQIVNETAVPNSVLLNLPPDAVLPTGHPARGKTLVDDRPTVYLCQGSTCHSPITDPTLLQASLQTLRSTGT
ncbi:MAG: thioredoxin domain-containing protein [Gammaproteobacteria bacterium]